MPNAPIVKTHTFEGPLDLLLNLIERRKMLINDISLAEVTDEYIARVGAMSELPVGETAEFISLAATLLLIKSRSLLPTLDFSEEESQDVKELEYRLAVYQIIKDAARGLAPSAATPVLYDGVAPAQEPLFIFNASITVESLRQAAQALIAGFPKTLSLPKVGVRRIVSLEETIEKLAQRVGTAFRLSFREFSSQGGERGEAAKHGVIVSFLALLELVKQGIIKADQGERFGDITLESDSVSTPSYE